MRLPHLHDLWTAELRPRAARQARARLRSRSLWGAFHKFVVGPALDRADDGFLTRIGRSLVGESLVGVAVLLAAAVLVDSKPPPRPTGGSGQAAIVQGGVATDGR